MFFWTKESVLLFGNCTAFTTVKFGLLFHFLSFFSHKKRNRGSDFEEVLDDADLFNPMQTATELVEQFLRLKLFCFSKKKRF